MAERRAEPGDFSVPPAARRRLACALTGRGARRAALLLAILALCLSQATAASAKSRFQRLLDRAGIPLTVPQSGKFILVNIPAFEVIAFRGGKPVIRSRAIVGKPWTRTPLRQTYVTSVRFRPTWRPTPSMVASGEYRDRIWPAGRDNPLGLAAIRLDPGFLVYLHDTNRRDLFAREKRAFSHGCVRVEKWDELVGFALDLDLATVHALAEGRQTFDMPSAPVPVLLGYFPTFPDADGDIIRHDDIYGYGGHRNPAQQ
ncbi:MAG: L,D-transpeptidase family protein [Thalassovita sp.]|nr:L,D-transpeptidase family protein [Thalassovita sp.]